jgi:hypothetical protein
VVQHGDVKFAGNVRGRRVQKRGGVDGRYAERHQGMCVGIRGL